MMKKRRTYGWPVTFGLALLLVFVFSLFWSMFISGPERLYEQQQASIEQIIEEAVPDIKGLRRNVFDYVTWQGYTDTTLYWFDATGALLTERDIGTLDYAAAKQRAADDYDMDAETIELAFGYDSPCYELKGSGMILYLDYDTLERVYQRETDL